MLISTKGRYALCVLCDLAEHGGEQNCICLKAICQRQDIPRKYLENIMLILTKNGLVESTNGKNGGYRLTKKPEDYLLFDVLMLTEESLAPVPCLEAGAQPCSKKDKCRTLETWKQLNAMITSFFENKTLADLLNNKENSL